MARIAGVDLPNNKRVEISLTYLYGIGRSLAKEIVEKCDIDPQVRMGDLSDEDLSKIREVIDNDYHIEGDLRRERAMNIKRLQDIGSYRGRRHRLGLPVRGQRTKTNARTRKGPARAIAGKKKPVTKK